MTKKSRVKGKVDPDPNTVYVHVLYTQRSEGGDPESDKAFANRSDEHTHTTFKGAAVTLEDDPDLSALGYFRKQSFPIPKSEFELQPRTMIYAVVGYYQDGDTFGTSYGNVHIVNVYGNFDKARVVAEQLRLADKYESRSKNPSIYGESATYVPWGGYFARLERVEVEVLQILSQQTTNPADTKAVNFKDIPSW